MIRPAPAGSVGDTPAAVAGVADRVLARGVLPVIRRLRRPGHLAVLAYHGVDDPDSFARHLDWIVRRANAVSVNEVADALAIGRPLPDNAVLVTFDDGHRSVLEHALPLLRDRGLPAAVYVVAGLVGSDTPFWWQEVEALSSAGARCRRWGGLSGRALVRALKTAPDEDRLAALDELRESTFQPPPVMPQLRPEELVALVEGGVAVGNHSLTHPSLPRCSGRKIAHEVGEAHRLLTGILGRPPRSFAYPYGEVDDVAARAVQEAGYEIGFLFDHRVVRRPPVDRMRVSRVRVDSTTTMDRFETIVSGLHPAIHRLRGRR